MEQTVFMGRGNSKAEFLGFGRRRQAAVTDCDISLPEVRSTEIIRARELAALVYAARLSRTRTRLYMLEFPLGESSRSRCALRRHTRQQPAHAARLVRVSPSPWGRQPFLQSVRSFSVRSFKEHSVVSVRRIALT